MKPWETGNFSAGHEGPELLFGRMHEDWNLESAYFSPGGRVFCVASAGCTSLALAARGHAVDAVDLNPAQVEYVRSRLMGKPQRQGAAERWLHRVRRLSSWAAPDRSAIRRFLMLTDPPTQLRYFGSVVGNKWRKALFQLMLSSWSLGAAFHKDFAGAVPSRFGSILWRRLENGFATHPNRWNSFAWQLFEERTSPFEEALPPITCPIRVARSDAAAFLEAGPGGAYDGFSLSNILDAAESGYWDRLSRSLVHAAKPGAVVILRGLGEPHNDEEREMAVRDRSMLWGRIRVMRIDAGEFNCFSC